MDPEECIEEQEMELEALESIYMEDYKLISVPDTHPAKFSLRIVPIQGGVDKEEDGNWVAVQLIVEYTPLYPSEVPKITLETEFGLSPTQIEEIRGVSIAAAEENLDQVMIYSIVEAISEWLQSNNRKESDGSAFSEMQNRARIAQEEADEEKRVSDIKKAVEQKAYNETEDGKRKRHGTPMSISIFHAWNDKFMKELEAKETIERDQMNARVKTGKKEITEAEIMLRPTGKSLFSKDVSALLDAESIIAAEMAEQEAREAAKETKEPGAPSVPVDASLFLEGDDDLLGDLSDLNDDD